MAEEMRELSNKTIIEQAEIYAHERCDTARGRCATKEAFIEGAKWFASQLAAGMKAIEEGY